MMSKELEALNKIQHDFGQLKGQELVKCYETIFNGLKRLEAIDNAKPSEITLRELVSKHILNPNSVVDVFEQDKNEPHYSNRIFMGMAWEMENHEIGNRKLKYIFSAVAETISESDRVCIEVK